MNMQLLFIPEWWTLRFETLFTSNLLFLLWKTLLLIINSYFEQVISS